MYCGYFCTWRLTALCAPCAAGSPLQLLRAHGNYLNGSLPASLGALPALQELDLFNNTLTGSLPPAVQGMGSLSGRAAPASICLCPDAACSVLQLTLPACMSTSACLSGPVQRHCKR